MVVIPENRATYVFQVEGQHTGRLFDYSLRNPPPSIDSSSSRSSYTQKLLRTEGMAIYGGCPFTRDGTESGSVVAAHLIPKAQGDRYMKHLSSGREEHARLDSVDDTRNILILEGELHNMLDLKRNIAFIKTPNFALQTSEVPARNRPEGYDGYCITTHFFGEVLQSIFDRHGLATDLRRNAARIPFDIDSNVSSQDTSYRPPDFLFDSVYATNSFATFGINDPIPDIVLKASEDMHIDDDDENGDGEEERKQSNGPHGEKRKLEAGREEDEEDGQPQGRRQKSGTERNNAADRRHRRRRNDPFDVVLALSYLARGTTAREVRAHREAVAAEKRQATKDNVRDWVDSLSHDDTCVQRTPL
ncbi:hypothetical protein EIP91_001205 [Steccherinum ochraceum]|uniref:HNH nuclease domain-containing protein n=1 Tax=Steccherinum ochraceum TaxID=92696 RepID=A0A4V2MXP2_9APHY|nr:hypothetical protein EIP91_001205 [Steccherinum ochraceum]